MTWRSDILATLAEESKYSNAASSNELRNGLTFEQWIEPFCPPLPDKVKLKLLLDEYGKCIEQLEAEFFQTTKTIKTPGLGLTYSITCPTHDPVNMRACQQEYGKIQFTPSTVVSDKMIEIIDQMEPMLDAIDRYFGYMFDHQEDAYKKSWFNGEQLSQTGGSHSMRSTVSKWMLRLQQKPQPPELQVEKEVLDHVETSSRIIMHTDFLHQWIRWNVQSVINLTWTSSFLFRSENARLKPLAETVACCWFLGFGQLGDLDKWAPKIPDSWALEIWKAANAIEVPQVSVGYSISDLCAPVCENVTQVSEWKVMALWINSKNRAHATIEKGLDAIWASSTQGHKLSAKTGIKLSNFAPWFNLGDNFYLLRVAGGWSTGDVCGFLKGKEFVKSDDTLMAIAADASASIPRQGVPTKGELDKLDAWIKQGENYRIEAVPC